MNAFGATFLASIVLGVNQKVLMYASIYHNGCIVDIFRCCEELYRTWVSVNTTASVRNHEYLQFVEVQIYEQREYIA